MSTQPRLERWERASEWPLTAAALVFLVAYAWPILNPDLDAGTVDALRAITWTAWALFVVDYAVRLALATDRGRFFVRNLVDLLVVALPLLRPLRLLRLLTLLHVLNRHVAGSLRGRVATYVVGATAVVLFIASLAILDVERGTPGGNISTFGDALWWSATTVTTVGYGDQFPVTAAGRVVAIVLMLCGIALIGIVTATFASWLLEKVQQIEESGQAATRQDVANLTREVAQLRAEMAAARPPKLAEGPGRA
jgi:voltage-gated potassium channel